MVIPVEKPFFGNPSDLQSESQTARILIVDDDAPLRRALPQLLAQDGRSFDDCESVAESIERAETDVRARLDVVLVEWERRQAERLERVTEREVERYTQIAMMALDERFREAREEAATRLQRELERSIELLARDELAQRLDGR